MKRLLSIFVSVVILAIIYSRIDLPALAEVFRGSDPLWMAISLGMVVPLTLATGWRLRQLMPRHQDFPLTEATKLTLSASVLNMVLPSKMGELAKAYFISDRGYLPGSLAFSLVVFEKASDLLSLFVWCVFGLLFYPEKETLFWVMTFFVFLGLFLAYCCSPLSPSPISFFGGVKPSPLANSIKSWTSFIALGQKCTTTSGKINGNCSSSPPSPSLSGFCT